MRPQIALVVVLVAAVAGFSFSAVSTYDSVAHLDRQVHGIHCSYLLGLGIADVSGSSGCHATLMSPYSSIFRQSIWGGIPVSLPAMSVFCFTFFWGLWLVVMRRQADPMATGFLVAATALPVSASLYMGYLALVTLKAACKLCIGIYAASLIAFLAAFYLWYRATKQASEDAKNDGSRADTNRLTFRGLTVAFVLGLFFVAVPVAGFAASAPDFSRYIGKCGSLTYMKDADRVLIPIGSQGRSREIIEVLDPLCTSCGAFERRFEAMPISQDISRRVLLFPLDNACNWMIGESIHPGACVVSEAVLCAGDDAHLVLQWAFEENESILQRGRRNPEAVAKLVVDRFPALRRCIGSPNVRARLNLALRWAVKNQLQVLTPQVFVEGTRLCDEDTDLGLDYALPRLIARTEVGASAPIVPQHQDQPRPHPLTGPRREPAKPSPAKSVPTRHSESDRDETERVDEAEPEQESNEMIERLAERAKEVAEQKKKTESGELNQEPGSVKSPEQNESEVDESVKPVVPPPSDQPTNEPTESSRPKEEPEAI